MIFPNKASEAIGAPRLSLNADVGRTKIDDEHHYTLHIDPVPSL
jgi:hypothetical protein